MQRERHQARCKTCGTLGPDFPTGWYSLSVNDPQAPNGKYRYIGLFCSVVCLTEQLPEISRVEESIQRRLQSGRS